MMETTLTGMNFDKQFSGYNKSQVDNYIRSLSDAYQTAYDEYLNLRAEHDELRERLVLKERNLIRPDAEPTLGTLGNSEVQARQIIKEAKERAKKIIDGTIEETSRAKQAARSLVEKAEAEAAAARKKARTAIGEAGEVLRINNLAEINADTSHEHVTSALNDVYNAGVPV